MDTTTKKNNQVVIRGTRTKTDIKTFNGEKVSISRFTVAVPAAKGFDFIPVKTFNQVETVNQITPGRHVEIVGRLKTDSYKNKEGKNVSELYVAADTITLGAEKASTPANTTETAPVNAYEEFVGEAAVVEDESDGFTVPEGFDASALPFA